MWDCLFGTYITSLYFWFSPCSCFTVRITHTESPINLIGLSVCVNLSDEGKYEFQNVARSSLIKTSAVIKTVLLLSYVYR